MLPFVQAEWTEVKINHITREIRKIDASWTTQKTVEHLNRASNAGIYSAALNTAKGVLFRIVITGESVLLDGRDISGNLGSKTTHGDNSPIIENVENSQIVTGNKSSIGSNNNKITAVKNIKNSQVSIGDNSTVAKNTSSKVSLNISLYLGFSLSVILNLYFIFIRKRKKNKGGRS